MALNRRTVIRLLLLIPIGSTLLPYCRQQAARSSVPLRNFVIDVDQERLLAGLAETIIPTTSTPGAATVGAHLFALKMLDDCYSVDDRDNFLNGLAHFNKASREISGLDFLKGTHAQREAVLRGVESKQIQYANIDYCYAEMRALTMQAYTTSSYYLTKIEKYELAPGRWHGCVPIKTENHGR